MRGGTVVYLPLPGQPEWVGLLGVVGVFGVVALLYALRDAGERARQVAATTGAFFLLYVLVRGISGIVSIAAALSSGFTDYGDTEWAGYVALVALGVAVGIGVVLAAHRRAAEAAEDLADDALVEPGLDADVIGEADDPDDYDDYTVRRQRIVAAAPWTDLAAVVFALALPVMAFGSWSGYDSFFGGGADVTVWGVLHFVLSGAVLAAPLLVVLRRERPDLRFVTIAAVVLSARAVAITVAPGALSNRYWSSFAIGLTAGLLTVAVLPLLSGLIPEDRTRIVAGLLAALALLTADVVVYGRAQFELQRGSIEEFSGDG